MHRADEGPEGVLDDPPVIPAAREYLQLLQGDRLVAGIEQRVAQDVRRSLDLSWWH